MADSHNTFGFDRNPLTSKGLEAPRPRLKRTGPVVLGELSVGLTDSSVGRRGLVPASWNLLRLNQSRWNSVKLIGTP